MHTPLCRHATGEPHQYAAQALELGLTEIGFSDHSPMREDGFDNWRMLISELDDYVASVVKARRDYPALQIRLALEVDYLPGHEGWIGELAARYPWDYLIGSVHYVSDSWAVDDPTALSKWRGRDPWEVWSTYFERLTMAAESRLFDIIGHADLCKKFCFYPEKDCSPLFQRFARAASRNNVAIEINTAGLRKDCREMYPSPSFLRLAWEERVPLTFGSDAHAPEEVGKNFSEAVTLARQTGYTHWRRLAARSATEINLG